MSYTPAPILQFSMPMVSVGGLTGANPRQLAANLASVAGTANQAVYVPFRVPAGVLVQRLWIVVGTTGGTDNWDLGLYTDGGVQIVHMGATLAGTASTVQFMNITDTYLAPGSYYMGWSTAGTTAHAYRLSASAAIDARKMWSLNQATAHPLPATATFATATVSIPYMGYCTTASP